MKARRRRVAGRPRRSFPESVVLADSMKNQASWELMQGVSWPHIFTVCQSKKFFFSNFQPQFFSFFSPLLCCMLVSCYSIILWTSGILCKIRKGVNLIICDTHTYLPIYLYIYTHTHIYCIHMHTHILTCVHRAYFQKATQEIGYSQCLGHPWGIGIGERFSTFVPFKSCGYNVSPIPKVNNTRTKQIKHRPFYHVEFW